MKQNPLTQGVIFENSKGVGAVTEEMIEARARELSLIAGHRPSEPSQSDREQAKRELTGDADADPKQEMLESIPAAQGWDRIPGSDGGKTPESPSEDEDEEGRSESQQLVEEGVREAGHDQMLQSAREVRKKDGTES